MPDEILTYQALRRHLKEAVRDQDPEWIESDGESPICNSYDSRLTELLNSFLHPKNAMKSEIPPDIDRNFERMNYRAQSTEKPKLQSVFPQ